MSYLVSVSPHIVSGDSIKRRMYFVFAALIPALISSVVFFKIHALLLILVSSFTAVLADSIFVLIKKKKEYFFDGSALLTGILLAMVVPPTLPLWTVAIGSFFAIIIVKQTFGGLGFNIFNPALAARAFLMASYPVLMTTWVLPFTLKTSATPLAKEAPQIVTHMQLFMGNVGGSLGETSALALLIGAIFLLITKVIDYRIPLSMLGAMSVFAFVFGKQGLFTGDVIFHLLAGGAFIGAFFMATDYITSPVTKSGRIIFGAGCGIITMVINNECCSPFNRQVDDGKGLSTRGSLNL
jgi:electron transport complex protein RnfD